jgi:hypothetical protein
MEIEKKKKTKEKEEDSLRIPHAPSCSVHAIADIRHETSRGVANAGDAVLDDLTDPVPLLCGGRR